jgi:uncharacterized membrane protein YvbJ
MIMVYCTKCGSRVSDDAYFCSKCGASTRKGVDVRASVPTEELRDALSKMGEEMEKAFSAAAREVREAFGTAAENIRGSTVKQTMVCPKCGQKTSSGASYCYNCGEKIAEK